MGDGQNLAACGGVGNARGGTRGCVEDGGAGGEAGCLSFRGVGLDWRGANGHGIMARQTGRATGRDRTPRGCRCASLIQGDYFVSWVPRRRILAGGGDGGLQDAGSVALARGQTYRITRRLDVF